MLGCWWVLTALMPPKPLNYYYSYSSRTEENKLNARASLSVACCLNVGIGYILFSWLRVIFGGSSLTITILVMIVGSLIPSDPYVALTLT